MLLHLTQDHDRHIERAGARHELVLLPGTLRCPAGHRCSRWFVALIVGGHVYPFPAAPFDDRTRVLHGRTADGIVSWRAPQLAAAQVRAREVKLSLPTCRRGHAWETDNIIWRMDGHGRRGRTCRTCRNAISRDYLRLRRASAKQATA